MEGQSEKLSRGNYALLERARELRNNATMQENDLWYRFLKLRPEQWYRQRIIGNFIVDFYCPKARLIIELDGMHHSAAQQRTYDEERSAYLASLGLTILRFPNLEIDEHFSKACGKILAAVTSQLSATSP